MTSILTPYLIVLFAALGQFFMAQRGISFSVFPALLFFVSALFFLVKISRQKNSPQPVIAPVFEVLCLVVILVVAAFFRLWQIDTFPCGVSIDQAIPGLGGLLVDSGWRPVFETPLILYPGAVFYPAAVWFHFFTPTQTHLALFSVVLSFCCFPAIYFTFRQLAGPGPALLTMAFWAVSRWDAFLSRSASLNILPVFFIYTSLAFWIYGLSKGKIWSYWVSGLLMGLGLYGYYSFRVFPLILGAIALWEARQHPEVFKLDRKAWLGGALLFTLVAAPLVWHWSQTPNWGTGQAEKEFIGKTLLEKKNPMPLIKNAGVFLDMFDRQGDPSPKQTTDQAPMLDGVTGALAVLGFGLVFWGLKEGSSFYPLIIFAGLSLNNILCSTPANILHVLPLLPCVLFFAGSVLWQLLLFFTRKNSIRVAAAVLALLAVGMLNYHQLFEVQAKDPKEPPVFDIGPTAAGKEIEKLGSRYDMILGHSFWDHFTVRFLGYYHQSDCSAFDWPRDLAFADVSSKKEGVCFLLAQGQTAIFQLLKDLYPQAETSVLNDPQGIPLVYEVRIPTALLKASRGMKWVKKKANQFNGTACLFVPQSGVYQFSSQGGRKTVWDIDGYKLGKTNQVYLVRGYHFVTIRSSVKDISMVHLFWMGTDGKALALDDPCWTQLSLDHGLLVQYGKEEKLLFEQWDPVVNYVSKADFNFHGSSLVNWNGQVFAPVEGDYSFLALTQSTDKARLSLDEKILASWMSSPSGKVHLNEGWHSLKVELQMGDDIFSAMNLAWKKPGNDRYQPISMSSFGPVRDQTR